MIITGFLWYYVVKNDEKFGMHAGATESVVYGKNKLRIDLIGANLTKSSKICETSIPESAIRATLSLWLATFASAWQQTLISSKSAFSSIFKYCKHLTKFTSCKSTKPQKTKKKDSFGYKL